MFISPSKGVISFCFVGCDCNVCFLQISTMMEKWYLEPYNKREDKGMVSANLHTDELGTTLTGSLRPLKIELNKQEALSEKT